MAAAVVVGRTGLLAVPEMLPFGAEVGELLSNVGLAFLGGWIINYLVVVLPRRRDRVATYAGNGHFIAGIAGTAASILDRMYQDADEELPSAPDATSLKRVLASTPAAGQSPLNGATWTEWIFWIIDRCDQNVKRIEPVYPYLEAELIRLITRIATSELTEVVRSHRQFFGDGTGNPTLLFFESMLFEHWERCYALQLYYDTNIQPHISGDGQL